MSEKQRINNKTILGCKNIPGRILEKGLSYQFVELSSHLQLSHNTDEYHPNQRATAKKEEGGKITDWFLARFDGQGEVQDNSLAR